VSGDPAADTLRDARLTLHHAAQVLASFAQAFVQSRDDDSHRSLTWDSEARSFRSERAGDGSRVHLVVPTLTAQLWKGDHLVGSIELRGRRPSAALTWLEDRVGGVQNGDHRPLVWPEYDLPPRPGGPDAPFEPDEAALEELADWYGGAARALEELFADVPEASAIRCWPHHFDLATLLTFSSGHDAEDKKHVGVGFSPGDEANPDPYYYVNGWPPPAPESLPPLEGPGSWHTEGWVGAVLQAAEIRGSGAPEAQEGTVRSFLTAAVDAMRSTVLSGR